MTKGILTAETRRCGDLSKPLVRSLAFGSLFLSICFGMAAGTYAQPETPPEPGKARVVSIPAVKETKLKNGLTVAVVERKNVPLVSVRLTVNGGQVYDDLNTAGLANMAATTLTKGTQTKTATQIAQDIEFLGADIGTSVGLDQTSISMNVTADKLDRAMAIFADVVLRPTFPSKEVELAKSQALDELKFNLTQPSFLANYVVSAFSLYGTPASGTPQSLQAIDRKAISDFYSENYDPDSATLVFVGDITAARAFAISEQLFGKWISPKPANTELLETPVMITEAPESVAAKIERDSQEPLVKRILVVDLPNSGQAAVTFAKFLSNANRIYWNEELDRGVTSEEYFPGLVANSILGGGYSSRLNQEIRIKRGLSYGAGSSIVWRSYDSRFSTRTQTKNESAAEVAELVVAEIQSMRSSDVPEAEMTPRRAVLTGNFSRTLETNAGLAAAIAVLYSHWLPANELNAYIGNVESVSANSVRKFAAESLTGGDIVIVGDYAKFKDDLAKRFPNFYISVIKASELDLESFSEDH